MEWIADTKDFDCNIHISQRGGEHEGVILLDVEMTFDKKKVPLPTSIRFNFPCVDTYSTFSSSSRGEIRNLGPNWRKRTTPSRFSSGVPIQSLVSIGGRNRLTVAISDAETACEIRMGIIEESGNHDVQICFFTMPTSPIDNYKATIRLDFSDTAYEHALRDAETWWSTQCGYKNAIAPECARLPMYSTWYSFHQNIDTNAIVEQCMLAKKMGMDSVIVDDGWQTEDGSRGYACCGDWEPCTDKVPDMKAFVDAVHECGMKFLIWFSVPFVGVNSKAYKRFEGKYLNVSVKEGKPAVGTLDPRFPDVREYLVSIYERAVKVWGVDGLKLDFIDSFKIYDDTPEWSNAWDTTSLDEAVNMLMTQIVDSLSNINPNLMIEFRQGYVGPAIRKYGNMLRVRDCPLDALINRWASIDMRLVSGRSTIHSDMIMWHVDDTVESAAIQVISTLFSVPQISVMIDKISESHRKMLKFYLDFWRENRDILLDGELRAANPESYYTLVSSEKDGHIIAVNYVETILTLPVNKKLSYVNGSGENRLAVRFLSDEGKRRYVIRNCMGEIIEIGETDTCGIKDFGVPRSGMLTME